MPKWKVQLSAPDTCDLTELTINWIDPIEGPKVETKFFGCIYLEIYDVLLPPGNRVVSIASVLRTCDAHTVGTDAAKGKFLWQDGNWKDLDEYIKYQQEWFLNLNVQQWEAKKVAGIIAADEPLMVELLPYRVEPTTPGSVTAPPVQELTDMQQIYTWNIDNNSRLGDTFEIIRTETANDRSQDLATHRWEQAGDARILFINSNQGLAADTITRIQADADVQFGIGKVMVEG